MIEGFVSSKGVNSFAFHLRGDFDCVTFLGGDDSSLVLTFLFSDSHEEYQGSFFVNGIDFFEKIPHHLCLKNLDDWGTFQEGVSKALQSDPDFCVLDFSKLSEADQEKASSSLLERFPNAPILACAPLVCPSCAGAALFSFYRTIVSNAQREWAPSPFSRFAQDLMFNKSPFENAELTWDKGNGFKEVLSPKWERIFANAENTHENDEASTKKVLSDPISVPPSPVLQKEAIKNARLKDFKAQWPTFAFFLLFAFMPFLVFWISFVSTNRSLLFFALCLILDVCFCFLQALCMSFLKKDGAKFTLKLALVFVFCLSFIGILMSALTAMFYPQQANLSYFCILFGASPLICSAPVFWEKPRKKKEGI